MAVQDRSATLFPTFTRAAQVAYREVTSWYLLVWCIAVTVFAALSVAVTFGASYWRYLGDAAAHDATVAAIDRFNAVSEATGSTWGAMQQIGQPALDLDPGAAVGEVIAATGCFGLLLAVALVLAAHGRAASAYVAALVPALSIGLMAGPLAWTAPMVPVTGLYGADEFDRTGMTPAAIDAQRALLAIWVNQDTATWWTWAIAAVAGLIGLAAVRVARRGGGYDAHGRAATPLVVDLAVVVVVISAVAALLGSLFDEESFANDTSRQLRLLAVTCVIAVLAARAAAASRIGTALALSVGFGLVHVLLYASFNRDGGAPGGWGVGSGGLQVHASMASAAILVVTPVIGWIAGAVWAHVAQRRAASTMPEVLPA